MCNRRPPQFQGSKGGSTGVARRGGRVEIKFNGVDRGVGEPAVTWNKRGTNGHANEDLPWTYIFL